jgi:hypothetical protein
MNITKKTIIIISIISVLIFALFIFWGFTGYKGDLAGWVQSGIAIIEIPIIIYGLSKIFSEIQKKPEFDYGLFINQFPDEFEELIKTNLPKRVTGSGYPAQVYLVLLNRGKLSAEDVSLVMKYKQFLEECHPVLHNPYSPASIMPDYISDDSSLDLHCDVLNPGSHDYIAFEIYFDGREICRNILDKDWELEFSIEIYSRELSAPITDSVFVEFGIYDA